MYSLACDNKGNYCQERENFLVIMNCLAILLLILTLQKGARDLISVTSSPTEKAPMVITRSFQQQDDRAVKKAVLELQA